jgi:hypothetical protein
LKYQKLFAALAIVSVVFFVGCLKDTYQEVIGICPLVLSTNPANGTNNVPLNQVISATFNQRMNPETITQTSFKVRGTNNIAGTISYGGNTVFFTPSTALSLNTSYTATITTAARDLLGNALQADYVWTFSTGAFFIDLQSADQFGILAGNGVINQEGQSEIHNMNVGISPGPRSSVTGFPPAIILNGALFASNDLVPAGVALMLTQAKQDLTNAYLTLEGATFPASTTLSGDQGGTTLTPGIYKSTSTLLIQSGDLTLNAQGDANAIWVFQIASNLTTVGGAGGNVILTGGAQAKNIFWQTGSSATIGDYTNFKGNVLALTSITMNSGASAEGRMLAINGAVVLTNTNVIHKP